MLRLIVAAAICVFSFGHTGKAFAEKVTEAVVEKACGDQIEGGCSSTKCATGCQKVENGKVYDYGCTFSTKSGATKANCRKLSVTRTKGQSNDRQEGVGGARPLVKTN